MFPTDFLWGAATSAYQVEGAHDADGRGPSVWDEFCRRPGAVWSGHTGDVACDHYRRFRQDVALMREIGLKAYRFSVSWPRVMPDGTSRVNEPGMSFYERLVDALLDAGIVPVATLFHWDYPLALHARGGWLHPESSRWFAAYAAAVAGRLSDRVLHWITLNEPQCFITFGHADGRNAPGLRLPVREQLQACHNALLAHGRGAAAVRAAAKRPVRIGWAPIGYARIPATDAPADVEAARAAMFAVDRPTLWNAAWYSDPVCLGGYPEDGLRTFGADMPALPSSDLAEIHHPPDFFGLNIYEGVRIRAVDAAATNGIGEGRRGWAEQPVPPGHPHTAIRWPVEPESLYWGPRFTWDRYRIPIWITENGLSNIDWLSADGAVHDPQRIDFTQRYLASLARAIADGVDVRAYLHWSLMDNFEWAEGYKERFGLIYVDYATQRRVLKDSARWYAGVIRTGGACLAPAPPGP